MDGTILDTLQDLRSSVNHALRKYGLPERSSDEIRSFLGNGMIQLVHKAVPEGTDEETEAAVLAEHKSYYPKHCAERTCPYQGITDLLYVLRDNGIKTSVVSNKGDENVKALVKEYFDGLFTVAVGAREGAERKPAPDLVKIALDELGIKGEDALYIGDSEVDVATAKAAALKMIAVTWGFRSRQQLTEAGAEVFVKDTAELKDLLLKQAEEAEDIPPKEDVQKVRARKQIKLLFITRVCLCATALVSTMYWLYYSVKLHMDEIFDPYEYSSLLRPVLYTGLIIAVTAICVSFALHAKSVKIKKMYGIK